MPKTPSDQNLLYQVKTAADPEAYAVLYDKYIAQIYRFVFFKVGGKREEAEDIASEVFLKTWQYLQEGKAVKSFSGLLYRIARNCIIDWYRKRAGAPLSGIPTAEEEMALGDGGRWYAKISTALAAEGVIAALQKLKQEYQEVITLRYIDELSIEEIAEITGKRGITVRVMIHRALKRLRQMLEQ